MVARPVSLQALTPSALTMIFCLNTFLTTSMPERTLPNTTCLPFSEGVSANVIKNWHPFVFDPELALFVKELL